MSTARLAVRDALVAWVTAQTGLDVARNLDFALDEGRLPCAAVRSGDDDPPDAQQGMDATGQAVFEVYLLVRNDTDPEAAADFFEALLRTSLAADPTLAGAAMRMFYTGGSWDFDLGDLAARRLVFSVWY